MRPSNRFYTQMLQIDPSYGQKKHQRSFMERIDRCHAKHPCTKEEPGHVHEPKCYPQKVMEQVALEQSREDA